MTTARPIAGPAGDRPAEILALPHPDWLYHHLHVAGDAAAVTRFRAAAAGAGVVPWRHDLAGPAEDWFHRLAAPPPSQRRSLSLEGARLLAGQLRDAAERRQARVAEQAARSRACPLDLHRLRPVPARLLRQGPDHPETLAWLWAHWGTTWPLRHVAELPVPRAGQPLRRDPERLWLGFWAADWTPWQAILHLRQDWPGLRITIRPHYDDP